MTVRAVVGTVMRGAAFAVLGAGAALVGPWAARLRAEGTPPSTLRSTAFAWESVAPEATRVGSVRRFFDSPTATLRQLELHVTTLQPGQSPHAPHRHTEEEMIIVKEGTLESILEGHTYRVGPGSVVFQASNELHAMRNVGVGPATYHVIKWRSTATPEVVPEASPRER